MDAITGFGVIENAGPNHLRGFLKSHAKTATAIDIGVAFVTRHGLAEVLPSLKKSSMNGPVRIVVGLYQGFTEPEALKALLAEQEDTKGRLSVRLSTNSHFHWKVYFLLRMNTATAVIGSSNLTAQGLGQSGEINAVLSLRRGSTAFKSLHKLFEEEWQQAVTLRKDQIERYAKARPKNVPRLAMSLKDILGSARHSERKRRPAKAEVGRQFWRDSIIGFVADETEQVIADTTNWDDQGFFWYTSHEPRHRKGDEIVMFDFSEGWVRLVQVTSTTRTPTLTPDGRQFTAYKVISKTHRRRLDKFLLANIVSVGLLRKQSEAKHSKKMTPKTFAALRDHLQLR